MNRFRYVVTLCAAAAFAVAVVNGHQLGFEDGVALLLLAIINELVAINGKLR